MRVHGLLAIVALTGLTTLSVAQGKNSGEMMPTGKAFLTKAGQINLTEIELGKIAERKGDNEAVRDFGQRMVEDHSNAQSELEQTAKQSGVSLPMQAGSDAAVLRQTLAGVSGAQFDEIYMHHMLAGHKQAIACFENEIEHGEKPAVKSYAEKILPVIQDHIRIAEDVAGKMAMSGKRGLTEPDKAIAASAMPH